MEGAEGVPLESPLLVASNHISNGDPLILGAFFPGTLFAMAKRELFRPAPAAWLLAGRDRFRGPVRLAGYPGDAPSAGFSALSRQVKATTSLVSGATSKRTIAVWLSTVSTRPVAPTA